MDKNRKLYRSDDSVIAGVCGGIAEFFAVDPTLVRILAVVLVVIGFGFPLLVYIVGMIIIPKRSANGPDYIDVKPENPCSRASSQGAPVPPGAAGAPSTPTPTAGTPGAGYTATNSVAYDATTPAEGDGAATPAPGAKRRHWSAAVITGVILVGLGILALLGNVVHVSFWRFWPVILILIGLVQLFTPGGRGWSLARAGHAISTISVGVVLLVWMLGFISFRTFVVCFVNLWPVLLVVAGLAIIGEAKKLSVFKLLGSLLFSTTLILGTWYYGSFNAATSFQLPSGQEIYIDIPDSPFVSPDVSVATINSIEMRGYSHASFTFNGGGSLTTFAAHDGTAVELLGDRGFVNATALSLQESSPPRVLLNTSNLIGAGGGPLNVMLPTRVTWDAIDLHAGASEIDLDLRELKVGDIGIEAGVSAMRIALGKPLQEGSSLTIKSGMAMTKVAVPEDCAVIIYSQGINSVQVDKSMFVWSPTLDAWCSNTYLEVFGQRGTSAGKIWTIRQDGVSSLEVVSGDAIPF